MSYFYEILYESVVGKYRTSEFCSDPNDLIFWILIEKIKIWPSYDKKRVKKRNSTSLLYEVSPDTFGLLSISQKILTRMT